MSLIATPGRMFDLIHQGFIRQTTTNPRFGQADHMLDLLYRGHQVCQRMLHKNIKPFLFATNIRKSKAAFSQGRVRHPYSNISLIPCPRMFLTQSVCGDG
jgi:ATP-dependent RNA helicase RhlE